MNCKNCIHFQICCLWATGDLEEEKAYQFCYGNFKSEKDVVEVVRCKDCEYCRPLKDGGSQCERIDGLLMTEPNDYCSYGKRREE